MGHWDNYFLGAEEFAKDTLIYRQGGRAVIYLRGTKGGGVGLGIAGEGLGDWDRKFRHKGKRKLLLELYIAWPRFYD